jgi:Pectate lyase superfamily protein
MPPGAASLGGCLVNRVRYGLIAVMAFGMVVAGTARAPARGSSPTAWPVAATDLRSNPQGGTVPNPLSYGADPRGAGDSSSAINKAAGVTSNGVRANVYLPAGTYHVAHQLNIGAGQCLYGDGRGNTTLTVGADFDPAAKGVISLTGREQQGPCVRDLDIKFAQPRDQSSRANFRTLAQRCTTGRGGSGCKYPPAIYIATANRFRLANLRIEGAWGGIINAPGNNTGGFWLDTIEMGALNVGLTVDSGKDFCHIRGYHFWNFGIGGNLFKGVYRDGETYAAQIGECDGLSVVDFTTFNGRVLLTKSFSWGIFTNLMLDGHNATLEVAGNNWLQIQGVYTTGTASGPDPHCQIDIGTGNTRTVITNLSAVDRGNGRTGSAVCVAGGTVNLSGGIINPVGGGTIAIRHTGGSLSVRGVTFRSSREPRTAPVVLSSAGILIFQNNDFPPSPGDVGAVSIGVDNGGNLVTGNQFNGWKFAPPGERGIYGPNHR